MAIKINWQDLLKRYINWQEIVRVYKNGGQIRPETVPPVSDDYLCFTAELSNSSVTLNKMWTPAEVSLEISYNKITWMDYNVWGTIALPNVGDKVYMRNKLYLNGISERYDSGHNFSMTWRIWASWNINYLIHKDGTPEYIQPSWFYYLFYWCKSLSKAPSLPATTVYEHWYFWMFENCTNLVTPPALPATTLGRYCYAEMFDWCYSLSNLPALPATTLADWCYYAMFANCYQIKLSETQWGEYQTEYRIPTTWTWIESAGWGIYMFRYTWWTFKGTPSINTTYYTSNQVI